MDPVFVKLNLKDISEVCVLNAPDSFQKALASLTPAVKVHDSLSTFKKGRFILAFVTKQKEIDALAARVDEALEGDALLWFAYPKGSSKKYTCDFNRDTGWDAIGQRNWEAVRMVAIDEDWSALRFRRVEFIKTMTRSRTYARSEAGKAKTRGK